MWSLQHLSSPRNPPRSPITAEGRTILRSPAIQPPAIQTPPLLLVRHSQILLSQQHPLSHQSLTAQLRQHRSQILRLLDLMSTRAHGLSQTPDRDLSQTPDQIPAQEHKPTQIRVREQDLIQEFSPSQSRAASQMPNQEILILASQITLVADLIHPAPSPLQLQPLLRAPAARSR